MKQLKIIQTITERSSGVDAYFREISRLPRVTPEEEAELAYRIAQGDEEAFARLVEANLRFVVSVAKQYQGCGMDLCDLIDEGNFGLMTAARRFDPSKGFKFISYAVWWIRQCIYHAMSEQSRMVRLPLSQISAISKITRAQARFLQENMREPTAEELSELVDLDPEHVGDSLRHSSRTASLDSPMAEGDDGGTLLDVRPDTGSLSADAGTDRESLCMDIALSFGALSVREEDIVRSCYGIGRPEQTLEEIGERLDLSRERVRQLKDKAVRKLRRPDIRARLRQYL